MAPARAQRLGPVRRQRWGPARVGSDPPVPRSPAAGQAVRPGPAERSRALTQGVAGPRCRSAPARPPPGRSPWPAQAAPRLRRAKVAPLLRSARPGVWGRSPPDPVRQAKARTGSPAKARAWSAFPHWAGQKGRFPHPTAPAGLHPVRSRADLAASPPALAWTRSPRWAERKAPLPPRTAPVASRADPAASLAAASRRLRRSAERQARCLRRPVSAPLPPRVRRRSRQARHPLPDPDWTRSRRSAEPRVPWLRRTAPARRVRSRAAQAGFRQAPAVPWSPGWAARLARCPP